MICDCSAETLSDVSDYEVRIRQLSDMLRRRRKEADMLKKERSKRMKDKLRAQEESLKKQLEVSERRGTALSLWMNVIERLLAQGESFDKRLEVSERQGNGIIAVVEPECLLVGGE